MTVVAHLSDLHFGSEQPDVAEALIGALATEPPDIIAISGDLTQRATTHEFGLARGFLDRLPASHLAVPGNHDIVGHRLIEMLFRPFRRWRRLVADALEPEWSDDQLVLKGVNTARPFGPYLNWSRGRFSAGQVDALGRTDTGGRLLAIACHHPLAFGNDTERHYHLATRADAVLAALSRQPRSLVLAGHRHRSHVSLWNPADGERAVEGRATVRRGDVLIVHAGTACSDRLRGERNSWNRLVVEPRRLVVETRVFDGADWRIGTSVAIDWAAG